MDISPEIIARMISGRVDLLAPSLTTLAISWRMAFCWDVLMRRSVMAMGLIRTR